MLLAVMIKLMKGVWSEVAILVISMLCSDLNPAALWSQPEQQPASGGRGDDHSSNCTGLLLSWGPEVKKNWAPAAPVQAAAWQGRCTSQALGSWFLVLWSQWEGECLQAIVLIWVVACDEGGMSCRVYPVPSRKQHSPIDRCVTEMPPQKCFRSWIRLFKTHGSGLTRFGGTPE